MGLRGLRAQQLDRPKIKQHRRGAGRRRPRCFDGTGSSSLPSMMARPSDGFLAKPRYLMLDRDPLHTHAFRNILEHAGVKVVRLPARSPNLNAFAERFVRSVKSECLCRVSPLGERHLRHLVSEYVGPTTTRHRVDSVYVALGVPVRWSAAARCETRRGVTRTRVCASMPHLAFTTRSHIHATPSWRHCCPH